MRVAPARRDASPSPRQLEVLAEIDDHAALFGFPPTVRELADQLDLSLSRIAGHLRALERKGLVTWERGRSRTLTLTAAGEAAISTKGEG